MGVDTIEDIMASGLDWTDKDFEYPEDPKRDYDDPSKLITIAQAERIIGPRPDASKPKPPTSKNPRPDTIQKYKDSIRTYKDRLKALKEWELKFDRLVAKAQLLENKKEELDDLKEDLADWCTVNHGTFVIRKSTSQYSWVQDPVSVLLEKIDAIGIPDEIESLDGGTPWASVTADMDEDTDPFPSVLITLGRESIRIISISDNLNAISDVIDDYAVTVQPKEILDITNAHLDQKSTRVLQEWKKDGVTNSQLDEDGKELKEYLVALAFQKEIQQLDKYPSASRVSKLVSQFLNQI